MRIALVVILVVAGVLIAAAWKISDHQARAQEGAGSEITITVSETERTTLTGDVFTFTSEVTNEGAKRTSPLIANLVFVSLDPENYVDPEDWSPERTVQVAPISADSSLTLTWTVKTVLQGEVAVYVTVLPAPPELSPDSPLAISPAIQMHVREDRKLNPGGVLPTVLAVPAVLAAGFVGLRAVRRRG